MSSFKSPFRPSRRIAAWLAFGAVGLATGAVWASGFQQTSGEDGVVGLSPAIAKSAPVDGVSALASTISTPGNLDVDWDGRWGSIAAPTTLFEVDLRGESALRTYNIAMLLANTSDLDGWASLQLNVELFVAAGPATDCSGAVYDDSTNSEILHFDDQDEGVYWNGGPLVVGGQIYCIGVNQSSGDTAAGTFLRGADDLDPPDGYPTFIATVDRAS